MTRWKRRLGVNVLHFVRWYICIYAWILIAFKVSFTNLLPVLVVSKLWSCVASAGYSRNLIGTNKELFHFILPRLKRFSAFAELKHRGRTRAVFIGFVSNWFLLFHYSCLVSAVRLANQAFVRSLDLFLGGLYPMLTRCKASSVFIR